MIRTIYGRREGNTIITPKGEIRVFPEKCLNLGDFTGWFNVEDYGKFGLIVSALEDKRVSKSFF